MKIRKLTITISIPTGARTRFDGEMRATNATLDDLCLVKGIKNLVETRLGSRLMTEGLEIQVAEEKK